MIDCALIEACKVYKSSKKETLIDKGAESDSKCLIDNSEHQVGYNVIEFENCVFKNIQSEHKKCDFGVETDSEIFYIELKGANNNQGLKQLLSTVENTKHCFKKVVKNEYGKEKFAQKKITGVLVVSQKQKPKNFDAITIKKLSNAMGSLPIIEQNSFTIKL